MDAEKVKEIVYSAIDNLLESLKDRLQTRKSIGSPPRFDVAMEWITTLREDIEQIIHHAEAAEQASIAELPWCDMVTRGIVGCHRISKGFCKYGREAPIEGFRCAYPIDEPAEDAEPVLTTEKAIRVLDTRTFEERFEEIEKSYWERSAGTIKWLRQIEAHLEQTDTAFSATLKGYIERLGKVEGRLRNRLDNQIATKEALCDLQKHFIKHKAFHKQEAESEARQS